MFQVGIEGEFGGEDVSRRKSRREQHEQERIRKEQHEQEKRQEQESRRNKQEHERKEEKEEQEKKERHSHERKGRKEKKGEGRGSFPLQYTRQDQMLTNLPELLDRCIVYFKQLAEQLIQAGQSLLKLSTPL